MTNDSKAKVNTKNAIVKALQRCWSMGKKSTSIYQNNGEKSFSKTKSCQNTCQVAPQGCFSVYVGPQRQRFFIKTEFTKNPLLKLLLEEAETVYGYSSEGPILLPCEVDVFYRVLAEMDHGDDDNIRPGCGFPLGYGALSLLSPSRRPALGSPEGCGGSYALLGPSRMIKIN